jgi:hypothetical protein
MRINASWPLAVLTVSGSRLSLILRVPRRLAIASSLDVTPDGLAGIFPTRALWSRGVGFTTAEGREYYFWARRHRKELLDFLRAGGWPVTETPRKPTKLWGGSP